MNELKVRILPSVRIFTNENDIKYALFEKQDVISDVIREEGIWEKDRLLYTVNILEKIQSGTVVDIGAGFGAFTIPLACSFNHNLNVVSFEPLKPIFLQLATNVLLNNIDNVEVKNVGLSDKEENIESSILDVHMNNNHGSYSFDEATNLNRNMASSKERRVYEFRTLDSYKLNDVKFIKLSAPGMERKVLDGAKETILDNNLPPILFECWENDWYTKKREEIFAFLESVGYQHFENVFSHVFAFKNIDQFDFFTSKRRTFMSGEFVVSEKIHDTKKTLEDQKVFGQE